MAIVPQKSLFGWKEIDELGDLERLVLLLETLPDAKLIETIRIERYRGRKDYPVDAVWHSILAGILYEHGSIASLRRELQRNAQLREVCGFDLLLGVKAVPTDSVYSRFLKHLIRHQSLIEGMFNALVYELMELLPDFGENLAIDGKAIASFAKGKSDGEPDGRRDTDGNWSMKVYEGVNKDGSLWKRVSKWFGYRLHLVVDTEYELPVGFRVTRASNAEIKEAHKLVDELANNCPELLERCQFFLADKGYDDTKLIVKLWDDHRIKSVIDIRNMWRDTDKTRILGDYENVCHDYKGTVYCYCPRQGTQREMAYGGFEKDRKTLKYRCPADSYGLDCKGKESCPVVKGIRIKLQEDRRIFTPLARSSYAWDRIYNQRTAVERVNSRLDGFFGFENHNIRGLGKMEMSVGLSLCVMLALAVGRLRQKQPELIRRLVVSA